MSDKKHIDRLFQEKLKNFEATPDDVIWDSINDRLHKDKRKRRVLPIWWKVAGVAALLALLFTAGIKLIPNDFNSDTTNPVVETENQKPNESNEIVAPDSQDFQNKKEGSSNNVTENGSYTEENISDKTDNSSNNESKNNRLNQNRTTVASSNKNKFENIDASDSRRSTSRDTSNKDRILNSSSSESNTGAPKDVIATSTSSENNSSQNNLDVKSEKSEIDKLIRDSKNSPNLKVTDASGKDEDLISEEKKEDAKKTESIEDAIALANTEDEKEKEKNINRWNISPNVAPVYFNSLGKGSPLDEQFVDNNKSTEVTMSYGVGGSYAINDRLKVRAGINKVDMGYNTNNILAFRSIDSSGVARSRIGNVSIDNDDENMTYLSTQSLNTSITPEIINSKSNGSLNQRFGFIEVPLEVEYALINHKLGVNVIGGFSTLIVDNNEIYSVIDGTETRIGEANNINNMSYSANFGLGINYHISEKVKVNVEPTFKYQINTFNNSSGDFQPYFIGIYTGLSYKF